MIAYRVADRVPIPRVGGRGTLHNAEQFELPRGALRSTVYYLCGV